MATLRERIEGDDLLFDSWIVSHGYALYSRDYDIVVNVPAALPPGIPIGDTAGSYFKGQYRFRFTHCPEVHISSSVTDETWRTSWDDLFADYEAWEAARNPEGFVWGVNGQMPTPAFPTSRTHRRRHLGPSGSVTRCTR